MVQGEFCGEFFAKKNRQLICTHLNVVQELRKPWFTPPRLAFPLVWSYIYASIGYASYMVGETCRELAVVHGGPRRCSCPCCRCWSCPASSSSLSQVYRDGGGFDGPARLPLMLYAAKMLVNWSFTPIFFLAKRKGLVRKDHHVPKKNQADAPKRSLFFLQGCLSVAALWVMVGLTGKAFYEVNRTAGLVFIPYQVRRLQLVCSLS